MNEEWQRNLAAASMAQGLVVEILLSRYLKMFEQGPVRDEVVRTLIETSKRTDAFKGVTPDEFDAEVFADVVVKMHGQLETLVGRALLRSEAY